MKHVAARLVPKETIRNSKDEFLAKNSRNIIEQPPYSPDMTPADIVLFSKIKLLLRGTRFQSIEDKKENSRR